MKITHRVSANVDANLRKQLSLIGVNVSEGFQSVEVDGSDPRWPDLLRLATEMELPVISFTKFTPSEMRDANYFRIVSKWHWAYPMPSDNFGYLELVYDTSQYCSLCGVGLVQRGPFQVSRTGSWGKRNVSQLHWVYDELFVRKGPASNVVSRGFDVLDGNGILVDDIVQIGISETVNIDKSRLNCSSCSKCGREKHLQSSNSFESGPIDSFSGLAKSREWFGSGRLAFKYILCDRDFYIHAKDKLAGIDFLPCR